MLYGFNLLLWTTHLTEDLLPVCERLKAAGYDGVEVPVFEGDPEGYAAMGRRLDDLGLRRTTVGVVQSQDANPMSPDAASRRAGTDYLTWMVACAEALGAETLCGPFYQPLAEFSGTGPTEDELGWLVDAHKTMAASASIKIAVEPLNRFECYALNTCAQGKRLVDAVGAANYGLLFDTFHANIEEKQLGAAIRAAGPAINHVHISENDRGTPGRGHVDFDESFRALKAIGYEGWLVVEAFGQALPSLAAATRVWRPLFDSEEQVYTEALDLMKRGWAAA